MALVTYRLSFSTNCENSTPLGRPGPGTWKRPTGERPCPGPGSMEYRATTFVSGEGTARQRPSAFTWMSEGLGGVVTLGGGSDARTCCGSVAGGSGLSAHFGLTRNCE